MTHNIEIGKAGKAKMAYADREIPWHRLGVPMKGLQTAEAMLAAAEADKAPAIRKVRALMERLGITLEDLMDQKIGSRRGRRPKTAKTNGASSGSASVPRKSRGKVAAKYRDDKGNSWSGRGKTPRWLAEAEKAG